MIKKLIIDISTACNHVCDFCSNPDKRTLKSWMKHKDFKEICYKINEFVPISSLEEIGLSGQGEPLLNKDLMKNVKWLKNNYNVKYLYLSTNGAMLTSNVSDELFSSGVDSIKISFNAFDKYEYEKVHGVDDYDRVLSNIDMLLDNKLKYTNKKVMISSVTERSKDEVGEFFKSNFPEKYYLFDKIFAYDKVYTPIFSDNLGTNPIKNKCTVASEDIFISSNGHMRICCSDYFAECDAGSLLSNSFDELWNGQLFVDTRDQLDKLKPIKDSLCYRCLHYEKT